MIREDVGYQPILTHQSMYFKFWINSYERTEIKCLGLAAAVERKADTRTSKYTWYGYVCRLRAVNTLIILNTAECLCIIRFQGGSQSGPGLTAFVLIALLENNDLGRVSICIFSTKWLRQG